MARHRDHVAKLEQVGGCGGLQGARAAGRGGCRAQGCVRGKAEAQFLLLAGWGWPPRRTPHRHASPACPTPLAPPPKVLRLLENDAVGPEEVEGALREGMEYYLQASAEPGARGARGRCTKRARHQGTRAGRLVP